LGGTFVPEVLTFADERVALTQACHRVAVRGLVIGTFGNLSLRCGEHVLLTPTGAVLADLEPSMITVTDLDGTVVDGTLEPTSELHLHLGVYRARPEVAGVAHAHAVASVAFGCTHTELPALHYTQLALGGTIRVAPYATFGTRELADGVIEALEGRQAAFMANHGTVAVGRTIDEACERLEQLEWLAELHARAHALGEPRVLSDRDLEAVFLAALSRRYGTVHELPDAPGAPRSDGRSGRPPRSDGRSGR
jgi:L-fuculose-phosphate aldolase